jgi:predicted nucleic acid-binding protein
LILYLDTSALIKLVVPERGSDLAATLWEGADPAATTILSYAEGRAALAGAHRSGRIREASYRDSLDRFELLHEELVSVGVDDRLARAAGEHAEVHGLRGYDAIHLATALELGDEEAVLVTWDRDLARAAAAAGLAVAGAEPS